MVALIRLRLPGCSSTSWFDWYAGLDAGSSGRDNHHNQDCSPVRPDASALMLARRD